ncbi:acetyl-coenzyme A synthetase 2-like, mitochondrial [Watersipora subatra]|uniref:acetyl-coenzyme A synthetase 2-like, mitochondrial n=1 Tax=Watersipora subatra TaxID=2589382 RepID=UPI00355B1EE1
MAYHLAARFCKNTVSCKFAKAINFSCLRCNVSTVVSSSFEFPNFKTHNELHEFSINKTDEFWASLAHSRLKWLKSFHTTQQCNMDEGKFAWFFGGQLNIADNCVDRHALVKPDKVALIWEKDEPGNQQLVTYRELQEMTCRIANVLKAHGVQKGDRVAIYMPNSPIAVASMLACVRIGAMHTVVFAGFSTEALAARIQDASCTAVITSDQALRGGKIIELKRTVDAAVAKCPSVKHVFVSQRTGADLPNMPLDLPLDKLMAQACQHSAIEIMESEDPSFMLYTSGSTGKPKGIQHSTAGYLLYASVTHQSVFNVGPDDVYACVADIGWITGHSYVVYGPLANGATTVLFESVPTYPDPGRYWEMVERLQINQFYTAPTAIRLLLKAGDAWPQKYNLSSLKVLGCVGEPLNHEAWHWYNELIGQSKCDLVDTWWQTETGGICITPRPSEAGAEIIAGMPMRPFFGIEPAILDSSQKLLEGNDVIGSLCIKKPWPGIARTIYGDHERYLDTYFRPFPGYYFSGDGAHRHSNGYYQVTGRTDDVINVSGHRLGTAEVEDAINEHAAVAESAVIGIPHPIKGEGIYAFLVLKDDVVLDQVCIVSEVNSLVSTAIAKFAVPDHILIVPALPKTRSGKIMRRILRKLVAGETEFGDVSTLADPSIVQVIARLHLDSNRNLM